ncbi:AraC family transcriptional regulator [Martelella radicis]|uniref:AraC-like DNA-binding protein n=1 Tax=Martelella radicis TaxID=1397476 RepID=A0A7W6KJC8_9HYPH|nr:AraC family transcriptional regulator [Martelella radicis]MBB4122326.1 AraC-like DNA-binding protein [Martelella radicis]
MMTTGYALDATWRPLLKDLGLVPADILRRAGLADDLLQNPGTRLASEDYYRLWEAVVQDDRLFPLRLCRAVRAESFSPPLFAALCSPNLGVALSRIRAYKKLIAPMRLDLTETDNRLTVEMTWLDAPFHPPQSMIQFELLFGVTLARMGTREQISPVAVETTALPAQVGPFEDFLGAPMKRAARNAVTFSASDAARPFLTSNESLWDAFEPGLRERLADLEEGATTVRRVKAALLEGLPSGLASIEAVAAKLSLSKRTLQRRIEAEGASYQEILQETREALAWHYLRTTKLPAAEISFLLGFSEPNSFNRAFRAWSGLTPEGARRADRDGTPPQQRSA